MEKRSDKYNDQTPKAISSRVSKNRALYDEINSKIGFEEVPAYETNEAVNLSNIDLDKLNRENYQKIKEYKDLISDDKEKAQPVQIEPPKPKVFDINKVLEEAKQNRQTDELEGRRKLDDEYNVLNNLNKKYLHQKGFTEEDSDELKELIDTITSKTLVDDIKDEEEKELLSELLATTIDIKLESELSSEEIAKMAELPSEDTDTMTNSFYSQSLELVTEDLAESLDEIKDEKELDEEDDEEKETSIGKIIFISLILIIVVLVIIYFVLQMLGVSLT